MIDEGLAKLAPTISSICGRIEKVDTNDGQIWVTVSTNVSTSDRSDLTYFDLYLTDTVFDKLLTMAKVNVRKEPTVGDFVECNGCMICSICDFYDNETSVYFAVHDILSYERDDNR